MLTARMLGLALALAFTVGTGEAKPPSPPASAASAATSPPASLQESQLVELLVWKRPSDRLKAQVLLNDPIG